MENCYRLPRKAILDVISSGSVMSGRSRVMPILDTILCRRGNGVLRVSSYDRRRLLLIPCLLRSWLMNYLSVYIRRI